MRELDALADQVDSEESFLEFLDALCDDFATERRIEAERPSPPYSSGALGWENGTVDAVLDAAVAWGRNSSARWQAGDDANPWRRCAWILLAGKFYE